MAKKKATKKRGGKKKATGKRSADAKRSIRTGIVTDVATLKRAKVLAAEEGIAVGEWMGNSLRDYVATL